MRNFIIIVISLVFFAGCKHEIGDDCTYDVDCSQNMDRNCDRNQPGGYCLVIGCSSGECPGEASCVEFTTPCPYGMDEEECRLIEANRGRTYCLKHCKSNRACRSNYECVEPEEMSAAIIDYNTNKTKICVPRTNDG